MSSVARRSGRTLRQSMAIVLRTENVFCTTPAHVRAMSTSSPASRNPGCPVVTWNSSSHSPTRAVHEDTGFSQRRPQGRERRNTRVSASRATKKYNRSIIPDGVNRSTSHDSARRNGSSKCRRQRRGFRIVRDRDVDSGLENQIVLC